MTKRQAVQAALDAYSAGDLQGALGALARHNTAGAPDPDAPITAAGAVADWISLACDRLRKELGEDVIAVVPVAMALKTALSLMPAPRSTGTAPPGRPKVLAPQAPLSLKIDARIVAALEAEHNETGLPKRAIVETALMNTLPHRFPGGLMD